MPGSLISYVDYTISSKLSQLDRKIDVLDIIALHRGASVSISSIHGQKDSAVSQ